MTRLTACMKQDDPHEALRVFEDMCAQGLLPDGHMCSMLLHLVRARARVRVRVRLGLGFS